MPAVEITEIAAELPEAGNYQPPVSAPPQSSEGRIEQLNTFVRRQPRIAAGVLAHWLSCENR